MTFEDVFNWLKNEFKYSVPEDYSGLKSKTFTNMKRCDIIKEWHNGI